MRVTEKTNSLWYPKQALGNRDHMNGMGLKLGLDTLYASRRKVAQTAKR